MAASTDDTIVFPITASTRAEQHARRYVVDTARSALTLISTILLGAILPALLFVLWWTATERHWIAEQILPPPAFVWDSLKDVLQTGELWGHVKVSAARVGWSLLIGGSIGLILGFGMGLSRTVKAYIFPTFDFLAQLPVLGWIPLLIIFVGIEEPLKVTAVSIAVVVPVALSTLNGIANIPRNLLEVGRIYRFDTLQLITRIVLPAAAPSLFTGLRQGVMQAWLSVVFVELLSSSEGLGFLMAYSRSLSQIDMVIVAMAAIGAVGIVIELVLRLIESRLQGWRRNAF
ncbi:MAG: ABC transporter permease [Aquabacterium sp.]|uniref:ABC transporter permease n=1 Tax=Aquabacterium sp. TaxID=1872578 RepID=UPI001205565D|nr:ABC transporter permease [Aquabacterium sp.]TAK90333.1 MAG: ABC transporter permease [Aquabacterium sp.]